MNETEPAWTVTAEPVEIELTPIGLDQQKGLGDDEAVLLTARGRRNRIRFGAPRYRNYIESLMATSGTVPRDIDAERKNGYDFHEVAPTLTLLPDRDCSFVAVEFGIELSAAAEDGTECGPVTTWEIDPREVVRELAYHERSSSEIKVGGNAGVPAAKLLAELTKEHSYERDGVHYVRDCYGYGLNFFELGWRFQASVDHELAGDIDDLRFVAKVPRGAKLSGRFHVAAEIAIHARVDGWLTRPHVPSRDQPVLKARYQLST